MATVTGELISPDMFGVAATGLRCTIVRTMATSAGCRTAPDGNIPGISGAGEIAVTINVGTSAIRGEK